MRGAALRLLPVWKEIRALALPWLTCVVVLIVPAAVEPLVAGVSVPAYFLGAAALGALAIGREYTDRTLSLLLSLPARRERLLIVKLGVLAAMLLTLQAVATTLVFPNVRAPQTGKQAALLLPVLCGLVVAPWLTMACRSPMAGTVFTMTIPGVLLVVGEWLGFAMYGRGPEMDAFRMALLWRGTLALCAIGAFASWRMFMRLEAVDGPGQDVRLAPWLRSSLSWLPGLRPVKKSLSDPPSFTKRNPVWLLVRKELHLQQMTPVVAGISLVSWMVVGSLRPAPSDMVAVFSVVIFLYAGLVALLIGAFGSASERQLGTLEWQMLVPMAASKQWAVKMGVIVGLTMLLAIGLPAVLDYLNPTADSNPFLRPEPVIALIVLAAGSLYVSSLCTSGLWALLMSVAATFGAVMFMDVSIDRVGKAAHSAAMFARSPGAPYTAPPGFDLDRVSLTRPTSLLTLLLVAGFIALVQRFALTNHRSADRPARRVWKHVILMAAFVIAGVMIRAGVQAFRW